MDREGMLTFGFDRLSTAATLYNYPYYPQHIERLGGFEKDNDYVEYLIHVPDKVPEKLVKISEMIENRYNLHVKKVTPREVREGYARKLFHIINATYVDLYGFVSLTDKQIDQYVKMFLPVIDFDLVTVVVDGNDNNKEVGIAITLSLIHISEPTRREWLSRMPSSA